MRGGVAELGVMGEMANVVYVPDEIQVAEVEEVALAETEQCREHEEDAREDDARDEDQR
jgi:hypothetical protein